MIAALLLAAATTPPPIVFEVSSELVLLDAFVTRAGAPVTGLAADDFEVVEGGQECAVELVSPAEVPLAALLVLDISTSVAGAKLSQLQQASDAFVGGLGARDQALLLTFSHALQLRAPLSSDRSAIRSALGAVTAGGRSSVNDALFSALSLAPRLPGRPVVVVFSDGADTSSWLGPQSARRAARESDTLVFAVGPGAPSLCDLTALTGGRCFAAEGAELRTAFERIVSELHTRYLLRVTPRSSAPGWHEVRVRLKRVAGEVRTRPGYWRPHPPNARRPSAD